MSTEQFAILQGLNLSYTDEGQLTYSIQNHPKLQEHQIRVKSFFGPVSHSDVGLSVNKDEEELLLMKFVTEKKDIPELTVTRTKSAHTFHLRKIPQNVIKSCEAQLDLRKVRALPNLTSDISLLTDKTGIDVYKDGQAGTLWIIGEWFQVSVAKSYLLQRYAVLLNCFDLECQFIVQEDSAKIKRWINMDDFMIMDEEHIPLCTFVLCQNIQYVRHKDDVEFSTQNGRVTCTIKSTPRDINIPYDKVKKKYEVLELGDNLPVDYTNLLVEMIKFKFNPEMLLMHKKRVKTYFVIPKSKVPEVLDFIKTYKIYNTPSNKCGIHYLEEIANARHSKSFTGLMAASLTNDYPEGPVESEHATISSKPAMKRPFATFKKDRLHMNYFCTTYMEDLKDIAKQFHGTLNYNMNGDEYVLEICADLPEDRETIRKYMEEVFNNHSIITELVHVHQLMQLSNIQDPVHIAPGKDASNVYVTGPLTTISQLTSNSQSIQRSTAQHEDQQAHLEGISLKKEKVSSTDKQDRRKRNRELVENGRRVQTREEDLNKVPTRAITNYSSRQSSSFSANNSSGSSSHLLTVYHSELTGHQVQIGVGDITQLQVAAIVNAANKDLKHVGGVARAIAQAAGPSFDEESSALVKQNPLTTGSVCVTGPGALPCKMVIHAVGPAMCDYDDPEECFQILKSTFYKCLAEANQRKCQSVAIPAISAGVYGVDPDMVARKLTESISDFLHKYPDSILRMIRLIDVSQAMVEKFNQNLEKLVDKGIFKRVLSGSTV